MWFILSLAAAFSETAKDLISKKGVVKIDEATMSLSLHLVPAILLIPLVIYFGIPKISYSFYWSLALFAVLVPMWSILYMKALKISPLSKVIPILAVSNIITALISPVFGYGWPSLIGWIGIITISFGLYLVQFIDSHNLLQPLVDLSSKKGSQYMLAVAIIWSLMAHLGKVNVQSSSALFSTFSTSLIGAAILGLRSKRRHNMSIVVIKNSYKFILGIGFVSMLSKLFVSSALAIGYAPYVTTIKRTNVFWSFWAGVLWFREKTNWYNKVGSVLILIGVVCIALT